LRLNDIIRAIDGAEVTIEGVKFETFQFVYHMPRTLERSIEIISEASRHIPEELKAQHPDIPGSRSPASGTSCAMTTRSSTITSPGTWPRSISRA
jgi:hypothetical protein